MPEVALNEILITTKIPNLPLALNAELYDIESTNTTEVKSQSVSTDNGNEHTVQKLSAEGLVATKIPGGTLGLFAANNSGGLIQREMLLIRYVIM